MERPSPRLARLLLAELGYECDWDPCDYCGEREGKHKPDCICAAIIEEGKDRVEGPLRTSPL